MNNLRERIKRDRIYKGAYKKEKIYENVSFFIVSGECINRWWR